MTNAKPHAMMVDEQHDEHARMAFVSSFKGHLTNEVSGGSTPIPRKDSAASVPMYVGRVSVA